MLMITVIQYYKTITSQKEDGESTLIQSARNKMLINDRRGSLKEV